MRKSIAMEWSNRIIHSWSMHRTSCDLHQNVGDCLVVKWCNEISNFQACQNHENVQTEKKSTFEIGWIKFHNLDKLHSRYLPQEYFQPIKNSHSTVGNNLAASWYFYLKPFENKKWFVRRKGKNINMNVINTWRHPNRCNQQHLIHHFCIFSFCIPFTVAMDPKRNKYMEICCAERILLCELCCSYFYLLWLKLSHFARIWI